MSLIWNCCSAKAALEWRGKSFYWEASLVWWGPQWQELPRRLLPVPTCKLSQHPSWGVSLTGLFSLWTGTSCTTWACRPSPRTRYRNHTSRLSTAALRNKPVQIKRNVRNQESGDTESKVACPSLFAPVPRASVQHELQVLMDTGSDSSCPQARARLFPSPCGPIKHEARKSNRKGVSRAALGGIGRLRGRPIIGPGIDARHPSGFYGRRGLVTPAPITARSALPVWSRPAVSLARESRSAWLWFLNWNVRCVSKNTRTPMSTSSRVKFSERRFYKICLMSSTWYWIFNQVTLFWSWHSKWLLRFKQHSTTNVN